MGFDAYNYWDVYDVPVPTRPDPTPSGPKNRAVTLSDVLAILRYVGTYNNGPPNANGVDYDSLKDGDWTGDTVVNSSDEVGLRYDRTVSPAPNPPWNAGMPDGAITLSEVLAALRQVGLNCSGGSGGLDGGRSGGGDTLDSAPNAMAVDAVSGGAVDTWRYVMGGNPFDMDIVITAAGEPYAGYDLSLTYNDQILAFVPTVDLDGDTTLESWEYTGLGGTSLDAAVVVSDGDGDTVADRAVGGSARSSGTASATGAVITGRFRCVGNGTSPLHLVTPSQSAIGTSTLAPGGDTVDTSLADASIWCWVGQ